ncbi:MAG TPA: UbiA family prenyltransferase [Dokdonella sp.]
MQDRSIPLCVDLDGTLIRSDLLLESALVLVRRNPLNLFRFAAWLCKGRAHLKRQIALRTAIDIAALPYDERLLCWLRDDARERSKILCTASDQGLADAVAAHVGGFDAVYASDGHNNLGGAGKAALLVDRFGERGFDYAGNAWPDLHVWAHARRAVLVNAPAALLRRVRRTHEVERVFERPRAGWRVWLSALRLHQWMKNVLVFVPLLAAHLALQPNAVLRSTVAFICFGLCASSAYLLNDLFDLEADRQHPRKRLRAFAAGALPIGSGLLAAPLLSVAALALGYVLSPEFALVLFLYCATTLLYSVVLKRIAMLDVVSLAVLYTIRIIAGAVAIPVPASFWLLAFSMFLFLSLAMMKRYTELRGVVATGGLRAHGRGYAVKDLPLIQALGPASGYLSVLVLALYINSTASEVLYRHPLVLWLWCPMLLYWISRAWLVSHRDDMHDDPVVFALTDPVSLFVLCACALVAIGAI